MSSTPEPPKLQHPARNHPDRRRRVRQAQAQAHPGDQPGRRPRAPDRRRRRRRIHGVPRERNRGAGRRRQHPRLPNSSSATSATSPTPRPSSGVSQGFVAKESRRAPSSAPQVFNAGPAAIEALNAGAIDATYIGPNPAINSYVKSKRRVHQHHRRRRRRWSAARGQTRYHHGGGPQRQEARQRRSWAGPRTLPSVHGWAKQGYRTTTDGGGDVAINPTENAQTLKLFQDGKLDGAWLPSRGPPGWCSRPAPRPGDEKDLWEKGRINHHRPDRQQEVRRRAPGHGQGTAKGHVESVDWRTRPPTPRIQVLNAAPRSPPKPPRRPT